jgi:opacity protein-like surface antigen
MISVPLRTELHVAVLMLMCLHVCGQANKFEFGAGLGMMVYQGDLTPSAFGSYRTARPGFNLHVGRMLNSSLLFRANLLFGRLAGDDSKYSYPVYRQQRNFKFSAIARELTGQLVWQPVKDRKLSPYVFGGAGLSSLRISRDWSGLNYNYFGGEASDMAAGLSADSVHRLPGVTPVGVAGIGMKYFLKSNLAINAEYSYRVIRTDYLDGFSVSANPNLKDHYMNYSVGVVYHTGRRNRSTDCPAMRY